MQVDAPAVLPEPGRDHAVHQGGEHGRAVHDGRVDHLTAPGHPGLEQGGQHAGHQEHAAGREVAEQVDRHLRWPAGPADGVQRAGDGDVGDVVAGGVGERTVLAPAGHAAVDQPRVDRHAGHRARCRGARRHRAGSLRSRCRPSRPDAGSRRPRRAGAGPRWPSGARGAAAGTPAGRAPGRPWACRCAARRRRGRPGPWRRTAPGRCRRSRAPARRPADPPPTPPGTC